MRNSLQILSVILTIWTLTSYSLVLAAQTSPSQPNSSPSESTWQLLMTTRPGNLKIRLPFIHFNLQARQVTGNTGCNNFTGTFKLVEHALSFNNDFVITKMSCPGINERVFFNNFFRTTSYDVKRDTLILQIQNKPASYWIRVK